MSTTPSRKSHEDAGNGSSSGGNHGNPSAPKYPNDSQGPNSSAGGKLTMASLHDYHASDDLGHDPRVSKTMPRNESRDAGRRFPLLPPMLFHSSASSNDFQSEHPAGSESRPELKDLKESSRENKIENYDTKSESRELYQSGKGDKDVKHGSRGDDSKDIKHARDTFPEHKGEMKADKDGNDVSNTHLIWKDPKEQHRGRRYPDAPSGNMDPWHSSHTNVHGAVVLGKESPNVEDRGYAEVREAVEEKKVDLRVEDKFKDKDRKRKDLSHWERDKERNDWRNNMQQGISTGENKDMIREERESERWDKVKKYPPKEKEKLNEREKDYSKREPWHMGEKDASQGVKNLMDSVNRPTEPQNSTPEQKKQKEHDSWKHVERVVKERRKERETDVESERPDKRSRCQEKEPEEGGMNAEMGTEREREALNSGIQQRKRVVRPRGSPPVGNLDARSNPSCQSNEGLQGKAELSVVYKIGECMQELIKLWKEYESSQADKTYEDWENCPTLEIRIPADLVSATNSQVRGGQLWGTDIYTVDSDLVAVLMHTGYCRPTASPPSSTEQELCATIRVLPPQDCYVSTLRNNVRSRAWGAAIICSYRIERCCFVKKDGGVIDLEPCLTQSSTLEPTLAPVTVERTMTTRAAASNASRQQRFVREVTIQFNHCMEPWLKYSISAVADKGMKKALYTSSRLKKGEVLYLETHSHRYELCYNGEKAKDTVGSQACGSENSKSQAHSSHPANGERNGVNGDSTLVDVFRWSRCKRALMQKVMLSIGVPLPLENVEVLEEHVEWNKIEWSQTGVWIAGKEYHLLRGHFLSKN